LIDPRSGPGEAEQADSTNANPPSTTNTPQNGSCMYESAMMPVAR
jgi:hypothetical protein